MLISISIILIMLLLHCYSFIISNAKNFYTQMLISLLIATWLYGTDAIHSKPQPCSNPPPWAFYDVVSHLSVDKNNISKNSTKNSLAEEILALNQSTLQSTIRLQYSKDNTTLEDVIVAHPLPSLVRKPFENVTDNVILVVLTNLHEHRLRNDQQIYNLDQIYRSFIGVHLTNFRFILINSWNSFNLRWVLETRKRVSFEVYQELPSSPVIGKLFNGNNGDIFIYDRCNLLTYYIPFPLSFIHTQQPILQTALLASYFDSPCNQACNKTTSIKSISAFNMDGTNFNLTDNQYLNQNGTSFNGNIKSSELNNTIPETVKGLNVAIPNNTVSDLLEMGKVLLNFFKQIFPRDSIAHNQTEIVSETKFASQKLKNETFILTSIETMVGMNNITTFTQTSVTDQANFSSSSNNQTETLNPIGILSTSFTKLIEKNCDAATCNQWSTENLLKARLCCLNSHSTFGLKLENSSFNFNHARSDNAAKNITKLVETNTDGGSFGCQIYARQRCPYIMPVIRCCLKKVMNKYFDFTIKLRQQQRKMNLAQSVKSFTGKSSNSDLEIDSHLLK